MIRSISLLACVALAASASLALASSVNLVERTDADAVLTAAAVSINHASVLPAPDAIVLCNVGDYIVPIVRSDPRVHYALLLDEPNQTTWPGSRLASASAAYHLRL